MSLHALPAVIAPSPKHPTIRDLTDREANKLTRFMARHPQYSKLPMDVLIQYADTYRDDADHAMEQELRDQGVLRGCLADLWPVAEMEGEAL